MGNRRASPSLDLTAARRLVVAALREDVGRGDITTRHVTPPGIQAIGLMRVQQPAVMAGLPLLPLVFAGVDRALRVVLRARDGQTVRRGDVVARITGSAASILTAERVALNFLQRLSGIATLTRQFVDRVAGTSARILDTRKTTPGLRRLEKYAVAVGGGCNHRFGLDDMVLIKDNHLAILQFAGARDSLTARILAVRRRQPGVRIEGEAKTVAELRELLVAGVDIVLLDNMSLALLRGALKVVRAWNDALPHGRPRVQTEASGGVNLKTVAGIARTGVDRISVGAITHSVRAVDISMDIEPTGTTGDAVRSGRRSAR